MNGLDRRGAGGGQERGGCTIGACGMTTNRENIERAGSTTLFPLIGFKCQVSYSLQIFILPGQQELGQGTVRLQYIVSRQSTHLREESLQLLKTSHQHS